MADLFYVDVARAKATTTRTSALILLHGYGSNELDLPPVTRGADPRLRILSARAPVTMGYQAYAWFPIEFTPNGTVMDADEAMIGLAILEKFVRDLKTEKAIDDVYLMGFSQGSVLGVLLALMQPELVKGVVGFSGRSPEEFLPHLASPERLKATSIWLGHGTEDPVLPIQFGRATDKLLTRLGVEHEYHEYPTVHTITQPMQAGALAWLMRRLDAVAAQG